MHTIILGAFTWVEAPSILEVVVVEQEIEPATQDNEP